MAADETSCTVERTMSAEPMAVYRAWTEAFDTWFATPGAIRMNPEAGEPYWFEVVHEGTRHPHYGRFLALEPGVLIEQTWVTGRGGTEGAETVVRIELTPAHPGARLSLVHRGFADAASMRQHADSWPAILEHLDRTLSGAD